jgi:hypothetical protein
MVGVAAIAFDRDLLSAKQVRDGYAAGAAALNKAIMDHFPKYGFADATEDEIAEIKTKISTAILDAFKEDSLFLTLFGGTGVGGGTYTNGLAAESIHDTFTLDMHSKKNRANYKVAGRLDYQK